MGFFQDYRLNSFSLGRARQLNTIPGQFRGIGGTRMMGSTYINFNNYNMGGTRGFYGYDYGCQEKGGFWNTFANWTMGAGILGNMFGGIFQSIGLAGGADGKGGVDKTKEKKTTTTPDFPNEAQIEALKSRNWSVKRHDDGSYSVQHLNANKDPEGPVTPLDENLYKKLVSSEFPEVKATPNPTNVTGPTTPKETTPTTPTDDEILISNALGDSKTIKNCFSDRKNNSSIGDKNAFIKEDYSDKQYSEIPTKISVTDNNKGTFEFEKTTDIITVNSKKYPVYELKNHTDGYGGINSGCKYALINGELVQPAESEYQSGESPLTGTGIPAWSSKLSGGGGSTDVTTSTPTKSATKKPESTKTNVLKIYSNKQKLTQVNTKYDNKTRTNTVTYKLSNGKTWQAVYGPGIKPGAGTPSQIIINDTPHTVESSNEGSYIIISDNQGNNIKYPIDSYGTRLTKGTKMNDNKVDNKKGNDNVYALKVDYHISERDAAGNSQLPHGYATVTIDSYGEIKVYTGASSTRQRAEQDLHSKLDKEITKLKQENRIDSKYHLI